MSIRGCLVKKASDQTSADYTSLTAVAWDAEIYDFGGFHDNSSSNTKLIVPAAVDGRYGVLYATMAIENLTTDHTIEIYTNKNGSPAFSGMGGVSCMGRNNGQAANSHWVHCSSAPILMEEGDEYELMMQSYTDSSITVKAHSNFGIHIIDALSTQMVLAKKSADQTTANYSTPTAVAWNGTDTYDTDAIHDPSSSNTKLIIPSALNGKYVIVQGVAIMQLVTNSSAASIAISKGGSLTYDGFAGHAQVGGGASTLAYLNCRTAPIPVVTGDEFELLAYCEDTSITFNALSSFGLRSVDY